MEIDRLKRKTQFIKNTYFYKEVTRGKPISHKIQPTNILLKDRLYRFCFRFYRSLARYEDSYATKRDLRAYYMILLFKELIRLGYRPTAVQNGKYQFEGRDFLLTVAAVEHEALSLKVEYRNLPAHPARHLLAFHVETEHRISEVRPEDADRYEGAEVLSLWELCYADTDAPAGIRIDTERELINAWLAEKLSKMPADRLVYQKYCPVCGYRGVDTEKDVYACPACSSRYMFDECEGHVHVWFRKIRKRVIS